MVHMLLEEARLGVERYYRKQMSDRVIIGKIYTLALWSTLGAVVDGRGLITGGENLQ